MRRLLSFKKTNDTETSDSARKKEESELIETVRQDLISEYHERFNYVFQEHELGYGHAPAPLEVFAGIAHALADASGYRVVLQAPEVAAADGDPELLQAVGLREVASAGPVLFEKTYERDARGEWSEQTQMIVWRATDCEPR